jgi:transcriptional regulator with XRE-family HTH domain
MISRPSAESEGQMRIGLKVAIVRAQKSQREIAAAAGIAENRLSQFIRGWKTPTQEEAIRIATVLGSAAPDLFRSTDGDVPRACAETASREKAEGPARGGGRCT